MHKVSIVKTGSYDSNAVSNGINSLLEPLGGIKAFVSPGERVLIKPNMLSAKTPDKAVTTHPAVVREVILQVRKAGGIPAVGDSPGVGGIRKVAEKSGILRVLQETETELVEFSETEEVAGTGLFRKIGIARPYLAADRIINLPKLKTHEMMTITCGVKNLFGAIVGTAKAGWHLKAGADREMFARLLLEIHQLRPPDLTIVDAVTAMEGDGPGSGDPRHIGCLIAGTNAIAVDLIAADILGISAKLRWVERAAQRLGIDGADRSEIEIAGTAPAEVRVADFRLPHISDVQFGLPGFLKNRLRHHLTSRPVPLAGKCILCGICCDACPPKAMKIENHRLVIDHGSCIRCFCCRELCPHAALAVREGFMLKLIKKYL